MAINKVAQGKWRNAVRWALRRLESRHAGKNACPTRERDGESRQNVGPLAPGPVLLMVQNPIQIGSGADQSQMGQGLRIITQVLSAFAEFFGI